MPKTIKDESEFLATARDRYSRAESAADPQRRAAARDLEFLAGNQWTDSSGRDLAAARGSERPALTINKLPPFVNQIVNEQRKNRPGVKVSPVGGGADAATAEVLEGIIRHIEYISQADVAYDTAFDYGVSSSFGYWRYTTEYVNDRSTDQEIKVVRIKDPAAVLMDPDAQEVDYSDAMWAFFAYTISKDEFKRRYPKSDTALTDFSPMGGFDAPSWITGDDCLVAEYWQVELEKKKLLMYRGVPAPELEEPARQLTAPPALNGAPGLPGPQFPAAAAHMIQQGGTPHAEYETDADESGEVVRGFFEDEDIPAGFEPDLDKDGEPIGRDVDVRRVWRYDINGHEVLAKPKPWAGKWIPIVPMLGPEKYVNGARHLFSAIRFALDPQQLYNYYKSSEAEVIQQTPKNPYIGYLGQFKTMQQQWQEANTVPRAYLEADPVMVGGTPAPLPQRQVYEPATQALVVGAASANEDIKATTGLFDASRGRENSLSTSGTAIGLLQQQGEISTWHFFDNFLRSMWFGYRLLVDLIPKIYDAPRVVRIVRPDDEAEMVQINRMFTGPEGERMQYNLGQGEYAVALSVQPSYATRKQQSAAELGNLAQADPAQLPLWADLFVKNLDLGPIGDEISDRLTPPQYRKQDEMNPQQMQAAAAQMMQQNQQLTEQVHMLAQQLEQKQAEQQAKLVMDERETQAKLLMDQRDNATRMAIVTMQEETKRMIEAHKVTLARITTRESMAHDLGLRAHDRAHAALEASQLPAEEPEGLPGDDTGADIGAAGQATPATSPLDVATSQPGAPSIAHGQNVALLNGKRGVVNAIHPDGSFDIEEHL